ncbi:VPA1269 family protein [Pseudomonas sp. RTC3]|uniref:gamma-mobile-trio integrase GmtZ n=1 Tax=Pseudomonas sp. 5C2 TaxID=3048588 RepID=UPI002AB3F940|nr:VPA1269 family protein [Pseudomonas sp. 5C2]MDY7565033.1 VPA1269 family protein [Pseudomonas sp. 5C2]MEB0063880.1 VPA1269 family protein [Pseudomonas sp. RTC3]MEB0242182.1 VPA1269 family protein [Pseudomonas sp. 5C2]
MLQLWSCGAVAWPVMEQVPFGNIPLMLKNAGFTEGPLSYLTTIRAYLNRGGSDDPTTFRFVLDQILSRVGIVTIGDLTPKTFYLSEERSRKGKLRSLGIQAVLSVVRDEHYKQTIGWTPEDFGFLQANLARMVRDDNFTWLISKDPAMTEWAKLGIEHLQTNPTNFYSRKWAVKHFLDYYLEHPELPRNPAEYFDIRLRPAALFNIPGRKGLKSMPVIYEFLNQVLFKVCALPGHNEVPILMPGFANPLPKPSYKSTNLGETHREAMPTRLISLAMHILMDNDFAWAKEVGRIKDVFRRLNPETGEFETIWSPIRVYAILMKLLLPARTYQVRMLDSGEGDTYRYRGDGMWETNMRALHPSASGELVERGVFRRYTRKDGSEGAIFYFNTNKTADIDSSVMGYVMRWEKKDALQLLVELRNWQEKFNPVKGPSAWSDLTELKKVKHSDELLKIGSSFFLFRDPANIKRPDLPVTDVRVRGLWLKLMEEMEKRLANAGETLSDGNPIRIISTRDKKTGQPSSAVFDLHSLRVSIITAMYEEGVPPEYLMKIVGHATVLMTLYYTKLSAETLSLRIDEALIEHQRKSQSEMAGFIKRASRQELEDAFAFRHPSALDAAASGTGVGLLVMDHGICPVSASRCHEGLAVCDPAKSVTRFQAVPGGATNCSRCRFFMTGPAFLIGLEAHVNDLAYRLKKASFAFEKTQEKFDALADAYAAALDEGEPFHRQRELEIAECAFESATTEVDNIALSLQAAYALTEQCIRISAQDRGNGLSLVIVGGTGQLEAALSEGHEFEQLNRICVNATLFDGLNINWQQPNLERARLFDRMLRNSGHESRFFLLNDEDALHVANAMAQFLYARLDASTVHALVDGRTTLRAVGLEEAFVSQLDNLKPSTFATNILGLA